MNADNMLKYGHFTLKKALERIEPEHVDIKAACGYWSVKDLVIHLTVSEKVLLDALKTLNSEAQTPDLQRFINRDESYGDATVNEAQHKSYEQVLADYESVREQALIELGKIDDATRNRVGTLPWYGADYDLEDFIVYTVYAHKREHSAHIDAFADRMAEQ